METPDAELATAPRRIKASNGVLVVTKLFELWTPTQSPSAQT
jgi:hypothetical protein